MILHPMWPVVALAAACLVAVVVLAARRTTGRWTTARRVALALLLLAVALRPTLGTTSERVDASNADVVLVIDRTTSMAAEDYDGRKTRLTGVQADVRRLTEELAGARFALVVFDNTGRVEMPFTTDATALVTMVDVMGYREGYYGQGSSIDTGLEAAKKVLTSSHDADPDRGRVLVYLGDGEQTVATPPRSFAELEPLLSDALVLGYGTTAGGRMRSHPDYDSYLYDRTTHTEALSKIDEGNLRAIAEQLGGEYRHRTAPGAIDARLKLPSGRGGPGSGESVTGTELAWLPGLGAALCLLAELWDTLAAYRVARRELR